MSAKSTIAPEVLDVLRRSKITGNVLVLPEGQLDRPLYEAVNKVIANAGGKWKRGTGHVFPSDPSAKLGLAIETGETVNEKKLFQAFYTPSALASRVVELANVNGHWVLEPSAGGGALVKEATAQGAFGVFACEINPECEIGLNAALSVMPEGRGIVSIGDFMSFSGSMKFDRIVMNPPFTKGQDIKHVAHAMNFLKPKGRLVAIMSPLAAEKPAFAAMLPPDATYVVHKVPAGTFKESGTEIATIIVVIDR